MTKWEEFAKSKGIVKKKKSKLVYDQATDSWLPRYGKDSIGKLNKQRDIIREHDGENDPFKEAERERKINKVKQELNEQNNKLKKKGIDLRGNPKKDSKTIGKSISKVRESSAGMGQFDLDTKKPLDKKHAKKAQYIESFKSLKEEQKRNQDILNRIL